VDSKTRPENPVRNYSRASSESPGRNIPRYFQLAD
jgi:hypothetical protein